MDELGLITRERLVHDQRRLKVSPTAKSRALVQRLAPQVQAHSAELKRLLGRDFIDALYGTLDTLPERLVTEPETGTTMNGGEARGP